MILTWLFPPSTGGIETNTYRLAKSMSKKNNVSVFTVGRHYNKEEEEPFKIFRSKRMDPSKLQSKDRLILSDDMKKVLENEKIDVVLSHNLSCLPTMFSKTLIRTVKEKNIPMIEFCGDARYKSLNKKLTKEFRQVLAVSNFVRKRLIEIGYDSKRVKTFHTGVPTGLFDSNKYDKVECKKEFGFPKNKKIILFPSRSIRGNGQFNRQKGFFTVLNSIKNIKKNAKDDFAIVFPAVVGRKDKNIKGKKNLAKLKLRIKKEGIAENVIFINKRISLEEMPSLYKSADIVVTPSVNEALGMVFLESLSMGVPAIGAKSGGIPESIVNGKTGFVIKPGDSKDLSKKIIKLLNNEKLRKKMGKASRTRALKVFSYEKMIKKLEKIIRKTIK